MGPTHWLNTTLAVVLCTTCTCFISDLASRRVDVPGFDGSDITVSRGSLYYTSRRTRSVVAVDLTTGDVTQLVSNVTRPGRIYVHTAAEVVSEPQVTG